MTRAMSDTASLLQRLSPRAFHVVNAVVSALALGLLGYILRLRPTEGGAAIADLRFMPAVNASLNAMSATLLVTAVAAIRRGNRTLHRNCILGALGCSAVFLVGYVAYHYVHGDTKYAGTGALKAVYLGILASHVILSAFVVPLALAALYYAFTQRFASHRRVTRFAYPIWLYVSVTGVVIFFMLRDSVPSMQ